MEKATIARRPRARALVLAGLVVATAAVLTPATLVVPIVGVSAPARPAAEAQGAAEAQEHRGEIFSFGITVPDEPITVGDTIVFPNGSELPHTITDRGGTFDTGEIAPGASGEITLPVPGRYEIFCQINPSTMNALVEVAAVGDEADTVRIQAYDEFREGETRRFDLTDVEVDLGATVTVANVGGLQHSLTAVDGSFSTGTIEPGAEQGRFAGTSADLVADEAGEFEYVCDFFPDEMRGVLRVVDPSPPTTAAPSTTAAPDDGGGGDVGGDPGGQAAAAPGRPSDNGPGGLLAAIGVVLLGLAAIGLALAPRGRRSPGQPSAS